MKKNSNLKLCALLSMMLCIHPLSAQTIWQAAIDDWNVAANWTLGVPGAGDTARINNTGTAQLIAGSAGLANVLTLGLAAADSGSVTVSNNSLSVGANLIVGGGGSGLLRIENGATVDASNLVIGFQSTANGDVVITNLGSSLTAGSTLPVGSSGSGSLSVENGAIATIPNMSIGDQVGSFGDVVVADPGSSLTVGATLIVGNEGSGVLTIEDGGSVSASTTLMANVVTGGGILNLTGTAGQRGLLSTQSLEKGVGGVIVNLDGGILQASASNPTFISNFIPGQLTIAPGGFFLDSQAFDIGSDDNFNGLGTMTKLGSGTFTYSGAATNAGGLVIDAGQVTLNGLLLGQAVVNSSGTLAGTGTVGAIDNFGIVAPGDGGIETLTVTGNHINRTSGTHQNELNAAGQTDLLAVGGTSTIQGGTLELIAAPGNYLVGTTYTLITAAGGLTGEFQTVIENIDLPYILRYFPNSLVLELGGFNLNGLSGNPRRVAEFINTFSVIEGDFLTVFDALNTLNISQLSNALDQMHPAPFQALAITTADTAHMVNDSFMDRLSFLRNTQCGPCDPCSRGGAWISGLADHLRQDRSQGLRRFTATNGGVALGYDKCFCDDLIVGAGAGYSNNNIHWSKSGGHSDGDLYYYGAYATKYNEDFYIDASVLGFNGQYKSKRHIEFADIDRRAKSKQCAYGVNPHIGAGLICNYCGIDVIPFAEADYYYFHHNKFREHGARSLNLHVKSYEGSAVRTEAGLRFTKAYDCYCGSFLPYTSISYVGHRYYGRKYKSSFNNQPSNFAVYGTDRCFNQAEFGVGFVYLINDCLAINTSYEIDFGDKRQQQEFNFQLNYKF